MKRSLVILGVVVIVLGLALSGCDKEVTDAGTPPLTRYQRVVIEIK